MGKTMQNFTEQTHTLGLYDPQFEHDACGIGAVVDIKGRKSHQTVDDALRIVERLEHRAGKDAEGKTGDGVGILLQISHKFFSKVADELNIRLGNEREYGVGMFFFPQNEHMRAQAMKLFEVVTRKEGLEFLAWRKVPVDPDAVGQKARDCMPSIWQCFIKKPAKVSKGIDFDRKLYVVRRVFEQASNGTYVPSLSSRTIVYKGMFLVHDLRLFYADLQDPDYESAIGMVHSRFSTNTNPSWMRSEFYAVPLDSFLFLRYVVLLTKEAAHMRDMLENLYFGNITPNDQNVRSGTALKKAMEQSAECEEKLTALLEDKEKTLLLRLINAENEIGSTMALENFILWFR